jgi:hypothetical protein
MIRTWWRAFSMVTLVALNTSQISRGHFGVAFCTGTLLSWVWWSNTRNASHDETRFGQAAYACGAGCGTVCGMFLGGLWR